MMGEHSPCDALVPSELGSYCVEQAIDSSEVREQEPGEETSKNGWRKLEWKIDDELLSECKRVGNDAKRLIMDSDDSQLWFTDYGVQWIRQTGEKILYIP
jgi:carnitine O-acetyltransferase